MSCQLYNPYFSDCLYTKNLQYELNIIPVREGQLHILDYLQAIER